jgi:AcrR family transcriptional regulator
MTPAKRVRDDRQEAILLAAQLLIGQQGPESVTMASLGRLSGLSRTAIYQYFSSREDVLAELVINEMADLSNQIDLRIAEVADPIDQVRVWMDLSLRHLAGSEHSLISQISVESLPEDKRGLLRAMHGHFMTTLVSPLTELGIADSSATCNFIFGSVAAAAKRVNDGAELKTELQAVEKFVLSGIRGALN